MSDGPDSGQRVKGLVTIIVPVFNRKALIVETLGSIRDQRYTDLEVLVIDDGSTDGTAAYVEQWIRKIGDNRFAVVALPHNVGKSAAVNVGFGRMRGEYVMVLDSDDVLLPDALTLEVQYLLDHPELGMVAAKSLIVRGTNKTEEHLGGVGEIQESTDLVRDYGDLLLKGNPIVASTALLLTNAVRSVGLFKTDLQYTHDWEYWIRVAERYPIGFIGMPVVYYRMNLPGASSLNRHGTFREICVLLQTLGASRGRSEVLRALAYEIKYNLWLAYHDGDPLSFFRIAWTGLGAIIPTLLLRHSR